MAFTLDEEKEASLLASFAEERIKEALALIAKGEEEAANEVLQKAIEQQESALAKYETTENEEQEETQTDSVDEEPSAETTVEDDGTADSLRAELEEKLSANIIALKAALEKIENPKAKEALQKIL